MKKERLQIIILVGIILFGISYAYLNFLFLPQWAVIQAAANRLHSLENQYQELLAFQKNQNGIEQDLKTWDVKVKQLNEQLPSQLDKPQLMVGIYTLAKQHSVNPQSITFEQAQTKSNYQELGMSFSCLGTTTDLLAMIHDLQFSGSQRFGIQSISLIGSQQSMRAELKLTAYAGLGSSNDSTKKPAFMDSPFGVDSPEKMFQP